MTQLSIVIPATGTQEAFDQTLVAVLENRPRNCEVIVPHAMEYQDPYELSDEVKFVPSQEDDLVSLINAGLRLATAPLIHLLQSGVIVTNEWADPVVECLNNDKQSAAAAPLLIDTDRNRRILAAGILHRNRGFHKLVGRGHAIRRKPKAYQVDGPVLQAAFIKRSALETIGAVRRQFGESLSGVDLAARLRLNGLKCVHVPESRLIGYPPYVPQGFAAAKQAEVMYWAHAREFGCGNLLSHGMHVTASTMRQLPRLTALTSAAGRGWGFLIAQVKPAAANETDISDHIVSFSDAQPSDAHRGRTEDQSGLNAKQRRSA